MCHKDKCMQALLVRVVLTGQPPTLQALTPGPSPPRRFAPWWACPQSSSPPATCHGKGFNPGMRPSYGGCCSCPMATQPGRPSPGHLLHLLLSQLFVHSNGQHFGVSELCNVLGERKSEAQWKAGGHAATVVGDAPSPIRPSAHQCVTGRLVCPPLLRYVGASAPHRGVPGRPWLWAQATWGSGGWEVGCGGEAIE